MMLRYLILLLIVLISTVSCKKDLGDECENLKKAIVANNFDKTKNSINKFISTLNSKTYTEENIIKLVQSISNLCDVSATVLCFDCIQTLPSQTEIIISFSNAGLQIQKTIDLSYSSDNKIVFSNLHD